MNTCSLFFYHEVIGHFRKKDIEKLKYLKGFWSSIAAAHYEKRRDLTVHLAPNTYYQRCNVELEVLCDNVPVRFEIDPAYDRVRTIAQRTMAQDAPQRPLDVSGLSQKAGDVP
ncbi:hypothetical protein QR680_007023 [Steinernema hermaphroditum]|uniref:Uncharacterized protein n=1 Tax=Steinernema hermaphroditum TaxID=289476 RepID=A0AA39HX99_9BILA|nr:hypothetical protein QR680_007023 [Steinernema hermaphroditum]